MTKPLEPAPKHAAGGLFGGGPELRFGFFMGSVSGGTGVEGGMTFWASWIASEMDELAEITYTSYSQYQSTN